MICPSCATTLKVHDIRPFYTCPSCFARVVDPRYAQGRARWRVVILAMLAVLVVAVLASWPLRVESDVKLLFLPLAVFVAVMTRPRTDGAPAAPVADETETDGPDMELLEACAGRLATIRARACAKGVARGVTFCVHPRLVASADESQDVMARYRDPLRVLGLQGEMADTDAGPALCGAGKRDAVVSMLTAFLPGLEPGAWEQALATRPAKEWFFAVAIQPSGDAVEAVIAHVRYGGRDCRFVGRLPSGSASSFGPPAPPTHR